MKEDLSMSFSFPKQGVCTDRHAPWPIVSPARRRAGCGHRTTENRAQLPTNRYTRGDKDPREGSMKATRIGAFEVQRITEFEGPFIEPATFFPDFDPEALRANPDMTGPALVDPATGKLVFRF